MTNAERSRRIADALLALIDREPPVVVEGVAITRQWLREMVEKAADVAPGELAPLVQWVLTDEHFSEQAKAEDLAARTDEFLAELRRRLAT